MPSLKEYKNKLASLKNTRKMTKTMKMVAASKLYKTMDAQRKMTAVAENMERMVCHLAGSVDPTEHPLMKARENPKNILVIVVTSDKGLCAGFNNNLIKFAYRWFKTTDRKGQKAEVSCCGRRGYLFIKNRRDVYRYYEGVTNKPAYHHAEMIGKEISEDFLSGKFDEVHIAYNHFINPISQKPDVEQILPLAADEIEMAKYTTHTNALLEPSSGELLNLLLPILVNFKIYYALLDNAAGENGARMTAMDNATTNASQLIDLYTLLRNRARQAAITKELIEIISGAEALKS